MIAVGEIVGPHGLRGLVRIRAYQPPAPSLAPGRLVQIELGGARHDARIRSAGAHGRGLVLVALEDVADRSAAEALAGGRILVRAADLPPPGEDEFYYHELAGFRVETTAGESLGAIRETFTTGVNDVWVVQGEQREHLIPVIADVVRAIDRTHRRIVIEPMPGLLE
jgi:16S rRNA processing protein RimM